jgi:NADH-quinone oxidoreductase subunit J
MQASTLVFYLLAAIVVLSALWVVFARNVLHSGFLLLGTLGGMAGLYLWLGADFVGMTQLLIYCGGILVLILFAVLLTSRIGDVRVSNLSIGRFGAAVPVVAFAGLLGFLLVTAPWKTVPEVVTAPTTARLGDAFLREYLLPFELASVVLLVALVGAMVIARRAARHAGPEPRP